MHDIIVVEAAGNGRVNLNTLYANLNCSGDNDPTDDSGAIIVGACRSAVKSCNGKEGHARWWDEDGQGNVSGSSYGSRIDCHAWGDGVYTTRGNGNYAYFGGTSAASAIVAGIVILVQSLWKNQHGSPLLPDRMRAELRNPNNGTAYCPDTTPREIKAMPNLAKLLAALNL